jgi:hypothetical protein
LLISEKLDTWVRLIDSDEPALAPPAEPRPEAPTGHHIAVHRRTPRLRPRYALLYAADTAIQPRRDLPERHIHSPQPGNLSIPLHHFLTGQPVPHIQITF